MLENLLAQLQLFEHAHRVGPHRNRGTHVEQYWSLFEYFSLKPRLLQCNSCLKPPMPPPMIAIWTIRQRVPQKSTKDAKINYEPVVSRVQRETLYVEALAYGCRRQRDQTRDASKPRANNGSGTTLFLQG